MSPNREKTTSAMGLVVSILLHGIFFAGCFVLDSSQVSNKMEDPTTINQLPEQEDVVEHRS
jgi:hypothetical protein